ncbi:MAG: hypothetical protein ACKPDI_03200 [Actinomycetota bacterium]
MGKRFACMAVAVSMLAACSGGDEAAPTETTAASTSVAPATTTQPVPETTVPTAPVLLASAASRSLLPTVGGTRDYLADAPGWLEPADPNDIGVYVPEWDQGRVDVGNGNSDGVWVHDDIRATALVLRGDETVVMAVADVYMIFAVDADEIERRARELLSGEPGVDEARFVISATHNHHGPDTAFSVNDEWYSMMADEMASAIADAWKAEPQQVRVVASTGEHRFGQTDGRDPFIVDPRLNVVQLQDAESAAAVATLVQWTSHPETTLGWDPPGDFSAACAEQGWGPDDCSADGRYFTADYPGVLRERLQQAVGGEVLFFNGALGNQIGPGGADVWQVDDAHPVGDGVTAADGALPVDGATDLRTRNMARTEAIGQQLRLAVEGLLETATEVVDPQPQFRQEQFFTRLTNIGFRVLLADGDLGWQVPVAYVCSAKPFTDETCVDDGGEMVDDPVLTPLVDSQIRKGDVLRTRVSFVSLGDVGFLFMPGELPPELVLGLPDDFTTDIVKYYARPDLHATGADYRIPGALLDLVPTRITFTVGLGGDELGYWVPIEEYRLRCLDLVMPAGGGYTCQRLFDEGFAVTPDAVAGTVCRQLADRPEELEFLGTEQGEAVAAVCRYGQALGRELGEPEEHYEETNAAGWDLVDDLWAAAERLFAD